MIAKSAKTETAALADTVVLSAQLHLAERMLKPQIKPWQDNHAGHRLRNHLPNHLPTPQSAGHRSMHELVLIKAHCS